MEYQPIARHLSLQADTGWGGKRGQQSSRLNVIVDAPSSHWTVSVSNLDPETSYSDYDVSYFTQSLQENDEIVPKNTTIPQSLRSASSPIL